MNTADKEDCLWERMVISVSKASETDIWAAGTAFLSVSERKKAGRYGNI